MKITKDGFIWKTLTEKEAMAYFNDDHLGELYLLFDDDSEAPVERSHDILDHNGEYGIEVGRLPFEPRIFWVVDLWQCSREIFETKEEAEKFADKSDKSYHITLSEVRNWYFEDGGINYEDLSDTFNDIITIITKN